MKRIIDPMFIFIGATVFIAGILLILIGWNISKAMPELSGTFMLVFSVAGILFMFMGFALCLMGVEIPVNR